MKKTVLFIFICSILFAACDTGFESLRKAPEAGYGRVAVTISGATARNVLPARPSAKYEYRFARVIDGEAGEWETREPQNGYFTLALGDWQVTVSAFVNEDDTTPAASGTSATFTVSSGPTAQVTVQLAGNIEAGSEGTFSYYIKYPADAEITMFVLENLLDYEADTIGLTPISGEADEENSSVLILSGTYTESVPAGYYYLTILLEKEGETTGANEVVYIYDKLDSAYGTAENPVVFTEDNFSNVPAIGTPGLAYELINDGTEYRVSKGTVRGGAVIIPADYNGLPVTEIGNANASYNYGAFTGTRIIAVTIPTSVTSIGEYAFQNCTSLTSIIFAEGSQLESIGRSAFSGCTGLTGITIPESVTSIGDYAFSGWTSSQTIYVAHFNQGAADGVWAAGAWAAYWRSYCDAVIVYNTGSLIEIEITRQPDKTAYLIGEQLDITGLAVNASYSNTTGDVTVTAENITGFDSATAGSQTLTVTYNGKTATFTVTVVDINNITVTNTDEWNAVLNIISTYGDNQSYTINVSGNVPVPGSTNSSFGSATDISVTLNGNGKLYLNSQGYIIYLSGNNQTLIIDSASLTLEGLTDGINNATQDNNYAVVYVGSETTLELRNGAISGNTSVKGYSSFQGYGSGVFVYDGGVFTMTGGIINGNTGISIEGSGSYGGGVHVYNGGVFTMSGGIISDNTVNAYFRNSQSHSGGYGGGVYVDNGGSFTMTSGTIDNNTAEISGGGVIVIGNNSSFTMSGGTISNNTATHVDLFDQYDREGGGGVHVDGGTFTMSGTAKIINNTIMSSPNGGGVYVVGGSYSPASFTMNGGEISGNTASGYTGYSMGGGVYVGPYATFTMTNGKISGNTVSGSSNYGGGVCVASDSNNNGGTFTMSGGEISDNTAQDGGGVNVRGSYSTFTMSGTAKISGNTATRYGGGVYFNGQTFTMSNGEITNNNSSRGGGVYAEKSFTMTSGKISGNIVTITSSYQDEGGGGGVYVNRETFTMNGGEISNNNVSSSYYGACGGGVYVITTFVMNNGTISGNTVSNSYSGNNGNAYGGGVYVATSNQGFRIVNGTVYGSNETNTSLRNTVTGTNSSGAALYNTGTAQRGTFSGSTWNSRGDLITSGNYIDTTIRVVNGNLQ